MQEAQRCLIHQASCTVWRSSCTDHKKENTHLCYRIWYSAPRKARVFPSAINWIYRVLAKRQEDMTPPWNSQYRAYTYQIGCCSPCLGLPYSWHCSSSQQKIFTEMVYRHLWILWGPSHSASVILYSSTSQRLPPSPQTARLSATHLEESSGNSINGESWGNRPQNDISWRTNVRFHLKSHQISSRLTVTW